MDEEQFIKQALCLPGSAIGYHVSMHLATHFPEQLLIEGEEHLFNVEAFAEAGLCTIAYKAIVYNQLITDWNAPDISTSVQPASSKAELFDAEEVEQQISESSKNAWLEVVWNGSTFNIIIMTWQTGFSTTTHQWILAENKQRAQAFFVEVCKWNNEVRGEVLVFDGGCWHKDMRLFHAIKGSTFDNLVLHATLKQSLRDDIEQFFAARSIYEAYNIPWKRGMLLVGPPGNGKTHAVKAIINTLGQPCLYVKSIKAEYKTDEDNIGAIFDRARKTAPCILVLEDLDSLLTPENRSFFLNELDGFAANVGIVTLATTNHPERLDPSILDRPSRFDRKYPFNLPEFEERVAYITMWNANLQEEMRISATMVRRLSEVTGGFSFAYLKELFLSTMMRWIARPQLGTIEQILLNQVDVLREQMMSTATQIAEKEKKEA